MKNILRPLKLDSVNKMYDYLKMNTKIIDFKPNHNNHYILKLKIDKISSDNYRLILNNNHLTVFIFESVEFSRPIHSHNFNLNELVEDSTYDELKSIDFKLPDENYYLINYFVLPSKNILHITLGKLHYN